MKICLIQKYPPIQGGISRDGYLLSLLLDKAEHEVFVVTNSLEVEENYRCFDTSAFEDIGLDKKPENSKRLKVFSTETRYGHFVIPKVNPSVTKLTSLATYVVEKYDCDLILGFYFEPYGMAAYLTSTFTGVPFGIMHGGRDIGQLLACPDIYLTYKKLLGKANFIIGTPTVLGKLNFMGIDIKKLFYQPNTDLFSPFFSDSKATMDLDKYRKIIFKHFPDDFIPELYKGLSKKKIKKNIPIIGMYSKSGKFKGIDKILDALSILKETQKEFHFIAVFKGEEGELKSILDRIMKLDLQNHVWIFPFMPFWHVGHFIRSCTAVCLLEQYFGITFHMPKIQNEVLASARCLVMSDEIARKQPYRHKIKNGENCFVVNPQETAKLASVLKEIISNKKNVETIAKNGHAALHLPFVLDTAQVVEAVDKVFSEISNYLKLSDKEKLILQLKKAIRSSYRHLFRHKPGFYEGTISDYCGLADSRQSFVELLLDFGSYILSEIKDSSDPMVYFEETVRYCQIKIRSKYNKVDPRFNPVTYIKLAGKPIKLDSTIILLPDTRIEDFQIDIQKISENPSKTRSVQEGRFSYIFQAAGNYHSTEKEYYISQFVRDVLDLCSSKVTPQEILDSLSKSKNVKISEKHLMGLLKDLQKKLVIGIANE